MPELDGIEATRQDYRRRMDSAQVKIVILTETFETTKNLIEAGAVLVPAPTSART